MLLVSLCGCIRLFLPDDLTPKQRARRIALMTAARIIHLGQYPQCHGAEHRDPMWRWRQVEVPRKDALW